MLFTWRYHSSPEGSCIELQLYHVITIVIMRMFGGDVSTSFIPWSAYLSALLVLADGFTVLVEFAYDHWCPQLVWVYAQFALVVDLLEGFNLLGGFVFYVWPTRASRAHAGLRHQRHLCPGHTGIWHAEPRRDVLIAFIFLLPNLIGFYDNTLSKLPFSIINLPFSPIRLLNGIYFEILNDFH